MLRAIALTVFGAVVLCGSVSAAQDAKQIEQGAKVYADLDALTGYMLSLKKK